jgi:hypothetical protein
MLYVLNLGQNDPRRVSKGGPTTVEAVLVAGSARIGDGSAWGSDEDMVTNVPRRFTGDAYIIIRGETAGTVVVYRFV